MDHRAGMSGSKGSSLWNIASVHQLSSDSYHYFNRTCPESRNLLQLSFYKISQQWRGFCDSWYLKIISTLRILWWSPDTDVVAGGQAQVLCRDHHLLHHIQECLRTFVITLSWNCSIQTKSFFNSPDCHPTLYKVSRTKDQPILYLCPPISPGPLSLHLMLRLNVWARESIKIFYTLTNYFPLSQSCGLWMDVKIN